MSDDRWAALVQESKQAPPRPAPPRPAPPSPPHARRTDVHDMIDNMTIQPVKNKGGVGAVTARLIFFF